MTNIENIDNRSERGELTLSHSQKEAVFGVLQEVMGNRTLIEVRGLVTEELADQNDSLRKLMRGLVTDLKIDINKYGPAESLIQMGFSDCFSDEKLQELANNEPESEYDRAWSNLVRRTAIYFLRKRG
jgi:hypothetical protein